MSKQLEKRALFRIPGSLSITITIAGRQLCSALGICFPLRAALKGELVVLVALVVVVLGLVSDGGRWMVAKQGSDGQVDIYDVVT